jgi:hypothetical protein
MSLPVIEKSAFWLHALIGLVALAGLVFLVAATPLSRQDTAWVAYGLGALLVLRLIAELASGYVIAQRRPAPRRKVTVPASSSPTPY